jgi:hypothetical protein
MRVTVVIRKLCTCIAVLLNDPRQNMENSDKHGKSGTRPLYNIETILVSISGQNTTSFDHHNLPTMCICKYCNCNY